MLDNNLKGIEPDFSKNSNFNPKSNVSQVKFGADAPVLEVELNELQQVQDKAREDLIRSMIPSGFTTPVEIDFFNERQDSNTLIVKNDAEAYVNGMRIFIPKGTIIDIGDSPQGETREDLVFLEVWKEEVNSQSTLTEYGGESLASIPNSLVDPRVGEETSRRIINKWRIRCAHNVNYKANPDGLRNAGTSFNDASVFAQGGREKPITKEDSIELFTCLFSQTNTDSIDNSIRNWNYKDSGLYIAGKGEESKSVLKTFDGYSLAIPMFRLHRRPNQGFKTGDYSSISRLSDPDKVANLLNNEKLSSVATGEVKCIIEGKTLFNLIDKEDFSDGASSWDSKTNSGFISQSQRNIPFSIDNVEEDTNYSLILTGYAKDYSAEKNNNLYIDIYPDTFPELSSITLTQSPSLYVMNFRTPKSLAGAQSLRIYTGTNAGNLQFSNVMLIKGTFSKENAPSFFKGFISVGDGNVKFDRFVAYNAKIVNGTNQEGFAILDIKLKNPYFKVIPVNDKGAEVNSASIAFRVYSAKNEELGWTSCNEIFYISNFKDVDHISLFCNNLAPSTKIIGFNIYLGSNLILKSSIDSDNESIMEIQSDDSIKSIDSDIKDLAFGDGRIIRRVKEGILNGSESWSNYILTSDDGNYLIFQLSVPELARTKLASKLKYYDISSDVNSKTKNSEYLGIYKGYSDISNWLYLSIAKTKLTNMTTEGLKEYLAKNPIKYYYQSKDTYIETKLFKNVKDIDDLNGHITRNIDSFLNLSSLDWTIGTQANGWSEYDDSLVFYTTYFEDKMATTNNLHMNGIATRGDIITSNYEGIGNAVWKTKAHVAIRLKKSSLSSPDIVGLKAWFNAKSCSLKYELLNSKVTTYPVELAKVSGNLLFKNDAEAEVTCLSKLKPKILLKHNVDFSTQILKGKSYIDILSVIPPSNFSTNGQSSLDGSLEFKLESDIEYSNLLVQGQTLQNLAIKQKYNINPNGQQLFYSFDKFDYLFKAGKYTLKNTTGNTLVWDVCLKGSTDFVRTIISNKSIVVELEEGQCIRNIQALTKNGWNFDKKTKELLEENLVILEGDRLNLIDKINYFEEIKSLGEIASDNTSFKLSSLSRNRNMISTNEMVARDATNFTNINGVISGTLKAQFNGTEGVKFKVCKKTKVKILAELKGCRIIVSNGWYEDGRPFYIIDTDNWSNNLNTSVLSQRVCYIDQNSSWRVENPHNSSVNFEAKNIRCYLASDDDTAYEQYKGEQVDVMLEEPLRGNINSKDLLVQDGQKTKTERYLSEYVFNGDEDWTLANSSLNNDLTMLFSMQRNQLAKPPKESSDGIASVPYNVKMWDGASFKTTGIGVGANIDCRVLKTNLATQDVDGFKKWLRDNPIRLIYELETPITEIIETSYNSDIQEKVSLRGQVGYKKNNVSGVDCSSVTLSPKSGTTWNTNETKECTFNYNYGDIYDLVGVPLRLSAGYAFKPFYNFVILKVLSDTTVLAQNRGKNLPANIYRAYFPSILSSTLITEDALENLQKSVSLTGVNYVNLLGNMVNKHLY